MWASWVKLGGLALVSAAHVGGHRGGLESLGGNVNANAGQHKGEQRLRALQTECVLCPTRVLPAW